MNRYVVWRHAVLSLCLIPAMLLSACSSLVGSSAVDYDDFDPEKEGILDVITVPAYDEEDGGNPQVAYYTIASFGRKQVCDPFAADAVSVYDSYDGRDYDDVAVDRSVIFDILGAMSGLDSHDTMRYKIFLDGEATFLYRELNVNWWTPCELYYYDRAQKKLHLLYTFDNEEVAALRIRDLDRLNRWSLS